MTQQLERRTVSIVPEILTREGSDKPLIQGYAALFNSRTIIYDMFTESIKPGAFTRALQEKHDCRSLFNHDPNYVLGRTKNGTLVLREDERGLWTETTPPDTQQARDVAENIRCGNVDQMSFAFTINKQVWTRGKEEELDHREIEDLTLFDISPVTYAAYADTSVGVRSTAEAAYAEARKEWERSKEPDAPVVITKPITPYILKLNVLRTRP